MIGAFLLLGAFGLAWGVGHSTLSLPFREALSRTPIFGEFLCKLIECPGCIGFHTGWIYEWLAGPTLQGPRPFVILLVGFAVAGSNFILARLSRLI